MKITIIANPKSAVKNMDKFKKEVKVLFGDDRVVFKFTKSQQDVIKFAKECTQDGTSIIIAIGGDGMLAEIISQIVHTNVKLGIIPAGTGNMIAVNLGIPLDVYKALKLIKIGNSKRIDIGKVNDRYFGFLAGCGLDAKIIEETTRKKKDTYGIWAYFLSGAKHLLKTEPFALKMKLDGKKTIKAKAATVMIANTGSIFGDIFTISPNAKVDDGKIDIVLISPKKIIDYFMVLLEFLYQKPLNKNYKIKHYKAENVEIKTKPCLVIQADGDIVARTPAEISVIPSAVDVFIP